MSKRHRRHSTARRREIDDAFHKWRRLLEHIIGKLQEFKRIAMRACTTDTSFAATIHVTGAVSNSRCSQNTMILDVGISRNGGRDKD